MQKTMTYAVISFVNTITSLRTAERASFFQVVNNSLIHLGYTIYAVYLAVQQFFGRPPNLNNANIVS